MAQVPVTATLGPRVGFPLDSHHEHNPGRVWVIGLTRLAKKWGWL